MLNPNNLPACHFCAEEGHTKDTCPQLPCKYCKCKGHTIRDCPKCPVCTDCGLKGHERKCPRHHTHNVQQWISAPTRRTERDRMNSIQTQVQLMPTQPESSSFAGTGPTNVSPQVIFPPITQTMTQLLETLTTKKNERNKAYTL
ncbi:hypothetical protein BJX63DRAFT_374678 [Aspergillus granulosus]|uniref:CCHC-type domain-containing protein n=1 Tax=Aspergillus granulosus TaxID=176169 RepID=A0ABR4H0I9_9EURO